MLEEVTWLWLCLPTYWLCDLEQVTCVSEPYFFLCIGQGKSNTHLTDKANDVERS